MPLIVGISRVVIGSIFLCAATAKLWNVAGFAESLREWEINHHALARACAMLLIVAELLVSMLLISNELVMTAALLAALMLSLFAAALVVRLVRHREARSCGCFGIRGRVSRLRWTLVWRNVALLALDLIILVHGAAG